MFIVIAVLWIVTDLCRSTLHYRGNTYLVLEEVPLLIGLVFLSPNLLVLSTVCAAPSSFTVLRRQPLLKVTFNVAATALRPRSPPSSTAEILGTHSPVSLFGWVAAAAALAALRRLDSSP